MSDHFDETRFPLTSHDVADERILSLLGLFPECASEGKVDFEKLRKALGDFADDSPERYGLSWAGKSDAIRAVRLLSSGTLIPCKEESVNWDTTENLIIEGENLEVLRLLQRSYYGKVKMIYIDPPYNTGNDFIYPDNYRDPLGDYLRFTGQLDGNGERLSTNTEASGRFHSNWLNMMYPRLFLARNLLREDGVIFVSIDNHEVSDLALAMNEAFGEENFVADLVWEKGRKNDARLFSVGHEYMLVYARSAATLRELKTVWRESKPGAREIWTKYLELRERHGNDDEAVQTALQEWYKHLPTDHPSKALSRYRHIDKHGPWRDRDISWPGGGGPRYRVPHPVTGKPCRVPEAGWRFASPGKMQEQIDLGLVVFREDHTEPPFRKAHLRPIAEELEDDSVAHLNGDQSNGNGEDVGLQVMPSVVYKQSQVAVKYLRKLMGGMAFDNPKDHEILARLIAYCTSEGDCVLDFFAGSGSTADAVLTLNQDGGNRRFILVQLPEPTGKKDFPTIADICKERVRRVIKKLNDEDNGELDLKDNPQDRGFKVLKLGSSNFKLWNADTAPKDADGLAEHLRLFADHVIAGRSQDDILYELLLKSGLPLSARVESIDVAGQSVYSVDGGALLVCLEDPINPETLRGMMDLKPERVLCLDHAFSGNDELKTNIVLEMKSREIKFQTV